jgi:putative membrane protein
MAADALSHGDKEFLKDAGELGSTEVALGNMAVAQATSPELKTLGTRLVADHSASNKELVALAVSKGVEMTIEPTAMQKKMLASFKAKAGAEFDKELMEHVRKDHLKPIALFTKAANASADPDVKPFAVKSLPALQEHSTMAGGNVSVEAH